MEVYDILLVILYLTLAYAVAILIRSLHPKNIFYQKYFLKGLSIKFFGGLSFALVYTYFYSYGGDTMAYYDDAAQITQFFFKDPITTIHLLVDTSSFGHNEIRSLVGPLRFGYGGSEFPVVRIATFLNILGMNSYFSTTILFAAFSYVGVWHFYLVFARRYPHIYHKLAIAVLFVPSVFFWGSGIMKDSIVLGFLGVIVYSIDKFLVKRGVRKWLWIGLTIICAIIIFSIKAYVIMALVPALVVWIVMNVRDKIKNNLVRTLLVPVLLVLCVAGVGVALQVLGEYNIKYSIDNFASSAKSIQSWHYVEGQNTSEQHGRGSGYTLGEYDPTLLGI